MEICRSVVASTVFSSLVCWGGSTSAIGTTKLNKLIKKGNYNIDYNNDNTNSGRGSIVGCVQSENKLRVSVLQEELSTTCKQRYDCY